MTRIEVFEDTQRRIRQNLFLAMQTKQAIRSTRIFGEGFRSMKDPPACTAEFTFLEGTTLAAARAFAPQKKRMAVLNFANPVEPGGGVLRGASAQEEYLCRASSLYPCLVSREAAPWYRFHQMQMTDGWKSGFPASDRIIYTWGVTVLREDRFTDEGAMEQAYTDQWYRTDVITAAAPYYRYRTEAEQDCGLEALFESRISNILETAIEHGVQVLILGAFGCGAFHNPPQLVARAFEKVLLLPRYRHAFESVCFAVLRSGSKCENISAFSEMVLRLRESADERNDGSEEAE